MSINKKLLQVLSALLILIFHVWMPLTNAAVSQYILKTGYIGVDIFFFLAAYSLADKKIVYSDFIQNRFTKIYLKFLLFTILAALYQKWSITRVCKIIFGIEFFVKGGGSFLWFIPAIMIFYLIYPFYLKLNESFRAAFGLLAWMVLTTVLEKIFGYTSIFIFLNRIPVIIAGDWFKRNKLPGIVYAFLIPTGIFLLYEFGFKVKLNAPIAELYYAAGLPLVIGLAWLSGFVKGSKALDILGGCTLELYALQVIFGTVISRTVYGMVGGKLAANLITAAVLWLAAIVLSKGGSIINDNRHSIRSAE